MSDIFIGIDPGTPNCGLVAMDANQKVITENHLPFDIDECKPGKYTIADIIIALYQIPDTDHFVFCIEEPFANRQFYTDKSGVKREKFNADTYLTQGISVEYIENIIKVNIPVDRRTIYRIKPVEWQVPLRAYFRASKTTKETSISGVITFGNYTPKNEHTADAYHIAGVGRRKYINDKLKDTK